MKDSPDVSILVLNWNGSAHLERCFGSLEQLEYPRDRVRVRLLDNGSVDDSIDRVSKRFPSVEIVPFGRNLGYAAAMNRGVESSESEIVVFLNNDTRVDPDFLAPLVRPIAENRCACTAGKILSWDGREIHFGGGGTNFHGIAFQEGMGSTDDGRYDAEKETLFACGAAMAIRREAFLGSGGFDEGFFAYYEDVDLGWRLWVSGERVLYVPRSRVYHHHSATSVHVDLHKVRVLHIRNPLRMIAKNYGDEALRRVLPAALLLTSRRSWYLAGVTPDAFRIGDEGEAARRIGFRKRGRRRSEFETRAEIGRLAVSDLVATNDILAALPEIEAERASVQGRRKRSDADILPLFLDPFRAAEANPEYVEMQRRACRLFGVDELFGTSFESAEATRDLDRQAGPVEGPRTGGR